MQARNILILLGVIAFLSGCTFTQRDYDLQQQRYERDRKIAEERSEGMAGWKW